MILLIFPSSLITKEYKESKSRIDNVFHPLALFHTSHYRGDILTIKLTPLNSEVCYHKKIAHLQEIHD